MASLRELLAEEGFYKGEHPKNPNLKAKSKARVTADESVALPIYICHNRNSLDFSKHKPEKSQKAPARNGSSVSSSKNVDSKSKRSSSKVTASSVPRRDEPAMDDVAVRAVISILSGYIGRYLKDGSFRESIREKCRSCLERRKSDSDGGVLVSFELGIEGIERIVENRGTKKEFKMKSLRNSISLLSIVSSLNSQKSRNGSICGIPNSHLSACAQLYLSIVYKLEKNDRSTARHLLQVFCDSPFLARTHLLPDLWEHFFLPHLLHLKIWYSKEVEFMADLDSGRMKALSKLYNEQMDMGTGQFAFYYKEWLRVGGSAPPLPSMPLPKRPSHGRSRGLPSASFDLPSPNKASLYQVVFGSTPERRSMDLNSRDGDLTDKWGLEEEEKECTGEVHLEKGSSDHNGKGYTRRSSSPNYRNSEAESWPETHKSDKFLFFSCQSEPARDLVDGTHVQKNESMMREANNRFVSSDIGEAISDICTSDSLSDCENAIRVIVKAWLYSHGDAIHRSKLSQAPVIKGLIDVLSISEDGEILELLISLLADLVEKNEVSRQIVLNSDPQLEIFIKLLKNSSIFLKAAVLLYLLKPKAKQMLSMDWVPLVLRVLEFGDQLQTLFTVRCSPKVAAFYFLDQILTGFDEDRNIENARQIVTLGGLSLMIQIIETGDPCDKISAALVICSCIQADGSCRHYLVNNLSKASILKLLVLENNQKSGGYAIILLSELLCLTRRTKITKFLHGVKNEGNRLNTMHILLAYLQHAPPEQRPLVAVILLQLDLLGDPLHCSVYREEAVDAIIAALDCEACNEKVQEQSGRALLLLGGHFSYTGEASMERWLLRQAGFDESSEDKFHGNDTVVDETMQLREEEATEDWLRKATNVMLRSGNKRFVAALSDSIAKGIPSLARASIVTIAWMSITFSSIHDADLRSMACSILMPQLIQTLNYDRALEERVLASFSLLNLIKSSEFPSMPIPLDNGLIEALQNLTLVTWTAIEVLSIITNGSNDQYSSELEKS